MNEKEIATQADRPTYVLTVFFSENGKSQEKRFYFTEAEAKLQFEKCNEVGAFFKINGEFYPKKHEGKAAFMRKMTKKDYKVLYERHIKAAEKERQQARDEEEQEKKAERLERFRKWKAENKHEWDATVKKLKFQYRDNMPSDTLLYSMAYVEALSRYFVDE